MWAAVVRGASWWMVRTETAAHRAAIAVRPTPHPCPFAPVALKDLPDPLSEVGAMRPLLPEARRRTRRKELKLSPAEWAIIEERARLAGVSPNRYIREAALGVATGAIAPRGRAAAARITRALIVAINRIGTNINQLARVAHESGSLRREAEFDAARDELMMLLTGLVGQKPRLANPRRGEERPPSASAAGATPR